MLQTKRFIFTSLIFIILLGALSIAANNDDSSETVPSEPQNLSVLFTESFAIITWDAPATVGNRILEYQFRYKKKKGTWSDWETNYNRTEVSQSWHTFNIGKTYTIEVRARNSAGVGAATSITVKAKYLRRPKKPTNLSATASDTAGAITLSWTAPTDNGGHPISYYSYKYRERNWHRME